MDIAYPSITHRNAVDARIPARLPGLLLHAGVPSEGDRCAGVAADAWTLMCVLDEIDYGVMLVDRNARLLHGNQIALRECATSTALCLEKDRLSPRNGYDCQAFSNALQAACDNRRSLLTLNARKSPFTLAVVPLDGIRDDGAVALLVTGKRQLCEPLSVELFARAYELTSAEGAVLKGLCDGLRPTQIAVQGGVSVSTVRTQISSIRMKTASSSIFDLVCRMCALPPITSALYKMG